MTRFWYSDRDGVPQFVDAAQFDIHQSGALIFRGPGVQATAHLVLALAPGTWFDLVLDRDGAPNSGTDE